MTPYVRVAGWVCVVILAVLSLMPAEEMVRTGFSGHAEHAVAYAGTGLLLGLAYTRPLSIGTGLSAYAAILEVLQALSPGRHPAVDDWLAGSIGGLIGVGSAWAVVAMWSRGWSNKPPG